MGYESVTQVSRKSRAQARDGAMRWVANPLGARVSSGRIGTPVMSRASARGLGDAWWRLRAAGIAQPKLAKSCNQIPAGGCEKLDNNTRRNPD
jgi:hypothetical protein